MKNNHPNRNWRKNWNVNIETCTAKHDSGIEVKFELDASRQDDAKCWNGVLITPIDEVLKLSISTKKLTRIMREAGDIYYEYLSKRS